MHTDRSQPTPSHGAPGVFARALLFCALSVAMVASADAQRMRYALIPAAERVFWNEDLGLEDTYLYGGRLGFTFGDYIGLHGFYFRNDGLNTEFGETDLTPPSGGFEPQQIDLSAYGADLIINMSRSTWNPFLKFGGGILRFDPENGDESKQILLKAGGGLRFGSPGNLQLQVTAEDWAFRVNRYRLTGIGGDASLPDDPSSDDLTHNLVVGAGLVVPFGGSQWLDDTPEFGLSEFGLPIEVMAGRLSFDDDFGAEDLNLVGARAGMNFGRMVGLRGYYWTGVGDDWDQTVGVKSWGGEAQFNLGTGSGFSPFLLAGAGQVNFDNDFTATDADGAPLLLEDRTALILGGGVALNISDQLRLNVAARDYLWSVENDLQDVNRSDQLRSNWLYSAGLSFILGGDRQDREAQRARARRAELRRQLEQERARRADLRNELQQARAERDTVTLFIDPLTGDTLTRREAELLRELELRERLGDRRARTELARERERARVRQIEREMERDRGDMDRQRARRDVTRITEEDEGVVERRAGAGYVSPRVIEVPVPQEGAIYLRYGPEGAEEVQQATPMRPGMGMTRPVPVPQMMRGQALSGAELREAVRQVLREEMMYERMMMMGRMTPEERELIIRHEMAPGAMRGEPVVAPRERVVMPRERVVAPRERVVRPGGAPDTVVVDVETGRPLVTKEDAGAIEDRVMRRLEARMGIQPETAEPLRGAELREAIRQVLREEGVVQPTPEAPRAPTQEEIDMMIRERVRLELERREREAAAAEAAAQAAAAPARDEEMFGPRWDLGSAFGYTGASFGDATQLVLGGRANFDRLWPSYPNLRFVPEVSFGFGDVTTFMLAGNVHYTLARTRAGDEVGMVRPYVGLGAGFMNYSEEQAGHDGLEFVLNPSIGAVLGVPALGSNILGLGASQLFVEYQGVSFFDLHRVLVGLHWQLR